MLQDDENLEIRTFQDLPNGYSQEFTFIRKNKETPPELDITKAVDRLAKMSAESIEKGILDSLCKVPDDSFWDTHEPYKPPSRWGLGRMLGIMRTIWFRATRY